MTTTIEYGVRGELDRHRWVIEQLRRNPMRLVPHARAHHAETMADLDAVWERARDAVEALAEASEAEVSRYSGEFGDAWRQLKSQLRRVQMSVR
jgi:hypothetical protein